MGVDAAFEKKKEKKRFPALQTLRLPPFVIPLNVQKAVRCAEPQWQGVASAVCCLP